MLARFLDTYSQDSKGLQKGVGLTIGTVAILVGAINFFIVLAVKKEIAVSNILSPSIIGVLITGLIGFISAFLKKDVGGHIQVWLFFATGLLSADAAHSGNLTSGIFLIFGMILIYQYKLGRFAAYLAAFIILVPFPLVLILGMRVLSPAYIFHAIEILLGLFVLIFLYALVFLRHELQHRADKALLETRVKERTADLEAALSEREAMLHEIHHRVKNNLQIIISMLRLETDRTDQGGALSNACLETSIQRIYAMSLVHETMYGGELFDGLDLGLYAAALLERIREESDTVIELRVACPIKADLDFAVPFGLLVNEVASLQDPRAGWNLELSLSLSPEGRLVLGLAGKDEASMAATGDALGGQSGLSLANVLVEQLKGSFLVSPPGSLRLVFYRLLQVPMSPGGSLRP